MPEHKRDFFGNYPDPPDKKSIRVIGKDKRVPLVQGDVHKILVDFMVSTDRMHCGIFEIGPHCRGEQTPPHKGDEFYYVIQGEGELCVEGENSRRMVEEEAGYLPSGYTHYWINLSDRTLRVLFAIAPEL
jgi:mannose-6-phosphate isomerase-like protein (cupin superfamily)